MSSDFNKICRFCMKEADILLPLFPQTKITHEPMTLMPKLMLYDGDGLPSKVCSCCVEQVNASYSFKLQCEDSDVTLRKLQSKILQVNILVIVLRESDEKVIDPKTCLLEDQDRSSALKCDT